MDSSEDFEDDPFSYKPLKRRKLTSPVQKKKQPTNKSKLPPIQSNSLSFVKKGRPSPNRHKITQPNPSGDCAATSRASKWPSVVPSKVPKTSLKDVLGRKEYGGIPQTNNNQTEWCPLCQVPLLLLTRIGVSPSHHVAECQEGSERLLSICPEGVGCGSQIIGHYSHYDHSELAKARGDQEQYLKGNTKAISSMIENPDYRPARNNLSAVFDSPTKQTAPSILSFFSPRKEAEKLPAKSPSTPEQVDLNTTVRTYISPVKVVRRIGGTFGSSQDRRQRGASQVSRHRSASQESVNLLTGKRSSQDVPVQQVQPVDFSRSDVLNDSLRGRVDNAIRNIDERDCDKLEAGPSRIYHQSKDNVVVDDEECDISLEPSLDDQLPVSPVKKWMTPIKVSAEKDSCELELSLQIDPEVHCTGLRVRVPLKTTDSGSEKPVEVSATYTDIKTTLNKKNNLVSECLSPNGNKENSTNNSAKTAWNQLFSRAKSKGVDIPGMEVIKEKGAKRAAVDASIGETKQKEVRKCPWYKKIKNTTLAVDVFNCGNVDGVSHYLLSHYHSDHYMGLSAKWNKPILASSITMRMAVKFSRAKPDLFIVLDPGQSRVVAGVEITAVDANHCPGSLMFVLRLVTGHTILHTGDCRAGPRMEEEPVFWNMTAAGVVDTVYLDTTYCRPEYDFPPQDDVIDRTADLVEEFVARKPKTAVLVGAYMIGKERIFKAIVKALDCKVWAKDRRVQTWECVGDEEILRSRVGDRSQAVVHVIEQKLLNWAGLGQELDKLGKRFDHILGVKPTGWTHSRGSSSEDSLANLQVVTRGQVSLLEVPYSEHSSYSELKRLVKFLRIKDPKQIIPTVNLRDWSQFKATFAKWIEERKAEGPESQ